MLSSSLNVSGFAHLNNTTHTNGLNILESLNFIYEDELSFMKKMSSKDLLNFISMYIIVLKMLICGTAKMENSQVISICYYSI